MLQNYFITAYRNLWKNKSYTVLNITGLGVGMACSFLIMLWVWDELTYNAFHQHYNRLYHVVHNWQADDGSIDTGTRTPYPLAGSLTANFPDIRYACRVNDMEDKLLTVGEKKIYLQAFSADSVFLEMFSFDLLQGSPQTALDDPRSIVLTLKTAQLLFGDENPMGKVLRYDNKVDVTVTGVVANVPDNSSFKFDFILPYHLNPILSQWYTTLSDNWDNNMVETYVQLQDKVSEKQVNRKIERFLLTKTPDAKYETLLLHPMSQWRLYGKFENGKAAGGLIDYVRIFAWTAGFILLIACINFMNLATARSARRAKEVGIRKVIGSSRKGLIFQFMGESNLLALLALVFAVLLITLLLPWFNQLTDKQLHLNYDKPYYWVIGLGTALLAGVLAGLYPAFYLSSFQPVRVLKSALHTGKNILLPRKVLVTMQFTLSIILIISVIVINQQLQYSKNRKVGYDRNHLITTDNNAELDKNFGVFYQELLQSGYVSAVVRTQAPITEIRMMNAVEWSPAQEGGMVTAIADYDYLPTFGIRLKQGRGFSREFATDSTAVLLNEKALQMMNFTDPIGEEVIFWGRTYHVIGIIENVLMGSPYEDIQPTGIFFRNSGLSKLSIRFKTGADLQQALAVTHQIFEKHAPSFPFDYRFTDEEYNKKFVNEERVGNLANTFAGLAIFISCLGLFGLATYTAQTRTKEIGIRKVLGANLGNIIALLSKEYVVLVILSLLIASPMAWYMMTQWLQNYPYSIAISWWIFGLAGIVALGIAVLTISYQSVKVGLMNPVKSLRNE